MTKKEYLEGILQMQKFKECKNKMTEKELKKLNKEDIKEVYFWCFRDISK